MPPDFVLTETYIRKRNRWALELQAVPAEKQQETLLGEFKRFQHIYNNRPNSNDACSVNAIMALMEMKGMERPIDWLDPSKVTQQSISSELYLGCKHAAARERYNDQQRVLARQRGQNARAEIG